MGQIWQREEAGCFSSPLTVPAPGAAAVPLDTQSPDGAGGATAQSTPCVQPTAPKPRDFLELTELCVQIPAGAAPPFYTEYFKTIHFFCLFGFTWLSEHLAFCSSKSCCGKVCRGEILEPMGSRWWDQQLSHLRPSVEGMTLWQCIGTCLAKTKSCVIVADWKRRSGLDGVPKPGIRTARLGS